MVDHGGSRGDAQLRHFPQAYGPALGRLQKQLVKAREARADLGRAPHHDLEHLLLLEQGADLEAGKDGGDLPADIAWLEAMSFGRGQIDPDFDLGFLGLALDLQSGDAVDCREGLLHILRRPLKRGPLRAVEPDDDGIVGAGQHFPHPVSEVRLHVPRQSGITVDHPLDGGDCRLVVGLGIDGQPELTGVDADHLISSDRASEVSADVADSGHGPQLARRLVHHAGHRRMRGPRLPYPVDQQVPLLERGQVRLGEQRPDRNADHHQDEGTDQRGTRSTDGPRKKRVVAALHRADQWPFARLDGAVPQEHQRQRGRHGEGHDQRGEHREHIRDSQRPEEGAGHALHEQDRHHGEDHDQGGVENRTAHVEQSVSNDAGRRILAPLLTPPSELPDDLVDSDDGIIDDGPHGDHEARQHHRVERGAADVQDECRSQQRQRDGDQADHRGPPRGEEGTEHDDHEQPAEHQGGGEIVESHLDEGRCSEDPGVDVHPRQARSERVQRCVDAPRHFQRIGPGEFLDDHHEAGAGVMKRVPDE